jgi:hypothetical protein
MMCTPRMRSVCGTGQHLDEAGRVAHAQRTAVGHERDLADLVGNAIGLELLLGLADPGDFRAGVEHPGNGVEVAVPGLAGHQLGNHDALFHRLVRQHRAGDDVADRPDTRQVGTAMAVDVDRPRSVELEADGFGIQAVGVGHAADGDDQAVGVELLRRRPCRCSRSRRPSCRTLTSPILTPSWMFSPAW